MQKRFKDFFPPLEQLFNLPAETVAGYVLSYINQRFVDESRPISVSQFTQPSDGEFAEYAGQGSKCNSVRLIISEGWSWLKANGFLAQYPDDPNFSFVTRKGKNVKDDADFLTEQMMSLLPKDALTPQLAKKVWQPFMTKDFDIAISYAYKQVEIAIREAAQFPEDKIGVPMVRKAFDPQNGVLTDQSLADGGEKQAYSDLFAGIIGVFKNPLSHRNVNYDDPKTAASLILFANTLLGMIENQKNKSASSE